MCTNHPSVMLKLSTLTNLQMELATYVSKLILRTCQLVYDNSYLCLVNSLELSELNKPNITNSTIDF